jgi:transposase
MKRQNLKFKETKEDQAFLIPPSLDDMIDKNHPVRIVKKVLDRIEVDVLLEQYKGGGTSSYHPRMLLKVLVYSYLNNIYSSRRIEAALKENIHFMWISGMSTPDHNTVNRFRSERLKGILKQVFGRVVELLAEEGMVDLKEIYIDGTKIEANANKYTFIWGKAIKTSKERIKRQLEELWDYTQSLANEELKDTSPTTFAEIDSKKVIDTINEINSLLKDKPIEKKKAQKIKYAEKNWPKNLDRYDDQQKMLNGRNSCSKTDPDATFMRMKEDHMKNGQLKAGYNWQISTHNQFILNYSIHQSSTDYNTLPIHLEEFKKLYKKMPEVAVADAGYGSEENYEFLDKNLILPYVKDLYFYKDQQKKKDGTSFNLYYNEEQDCFYCPMGQPMRLTGKKKRVTTNGYEQVYQNYTALNCTGCPMRGACNKQKGNNQISINHNLKKHVDKARNLLHSEKGISYRKKRSIEPEPVFGNIKQNKGYKRFLLRGKDKVEIEVGLLSIAHNLKKWSC